MLLLCLTCLLSLDYDYLSLKRCKAEDSILLLSAVTPGTFGRCPRGYGVMGNTHAYNATGLGLIPATSKCFSPADKRVKLDTIIFLFSSDP